MQLVKLTYHYGLKNKSVKASTESFALVNLLTFHTSLYYESFNPMLCYYLVIYLLAEAFQRIVWDFNVNTVKTDANFAARFS